ncbi:MAG: MFS transporter, partial [Methanoregula sp.]|nr:MFS transporter [Methanoregula sp.]
MEVRYRHAALLIVALGALMVSVDTTIVNISLPGIAATFGVDPAAVSWVVMIYLTALACALPAMGKLGDIYGYRFVFATGCGLFTVSSLMCGISHSAIDLIVFRALQGIGAAALYAIGPAILMQYIPEEKHGWALGIMTTMVSAGIAIGPVLGGFISQYASWNWIFLVNVPVGILMVAVTLRDLPEDERIKTSSSFDFLGALFIFLALITLLFPISRGLSLGWTSPIIAGCLCSSLLFWILFVLRQRSCSNPLINIRIFGNGAFLAGNIVAFIMTLVINGAKYLFPYFFLNVQGLNPSFTGLILAVPAVTLIVTGLVAGSLSDRYSSWGLVGISFIQTVILFILFGMFGPETSLLFIIGAFALEGIATGLY